MKNTKTEMRFFTVADWEQEQEYLSRKHGSGWKFVKVNGLFFYHFEKCEPEDVVYQLDYNPEGMENKAEYVQMFADCGWEYLQDYVGYSYFRKPQAQMQTNESIFCDDESRLDMLMRMLKGRMLPLLMLFFVLLIPGIVLQTSMGNWVLVCIYAALIALYGYVFVRFARKLLQYRKSIEEK